MSAASSGSMLPMSSAARASGKSSMNSAWYSSSISEMASGGAAVVQMGEHTGALLGVQLLQDVGYVGGCSSSKRRWVTDSCTSDRSRSSRSM